MSSQVILTVDDAKRFVAETIGTGTPLRNRREFNTAAQHHESVAAITGDYNVSNRHAAIAKVFRNAADRCRRMVQRN